MVVLGGRPGIRPPGPRKRRTLALSKITGLHATTAPPLSNAQIKHIPRRTRPTTRKDQHLFRSKAGDHSAVAQEGELRTGPRSTLHQQSRARAR